MTITKEQAITATEFHFGACRVHIGPRGGIVVDRAVWRKNGQVQQWKTAPERFLVPIKYGLYEFDYITQDTAEAWHTNDDCPLERPVITQNVSNVRSDRKPSKDRLLCPECRDPDDHTAGCSLKGVWIRERGRRR